MLALRAGAESLNVSRHAFGRTGPRVFSGYVEEPSGIGDGNLTNGLLWQAG